MTTTILTIAGSDSCAGAGMQIDMKTAAAHGVYAACALTAITAQNTRVVSAVQLADPEVLKAQIDAVFDDMAPQAIKIGMLGSAELAQTVAESLAQHRDVPVVLDPVLVATAGGKLTDAAAFDVIAGTLVPQAAVITPNIPEAQALTGVAITDAQTMQQAANNFLETGVGAVLIKGGHGTDEVIVDRLYTAERTLEFYAKRLPGEYHGTGCSISTAIACNLALGKSLEEAVASAHEYLKDALQHVLELGHGSRIFNPLNRLNEPYGV